MFDETSNPLPADAARVNVHEEREVSYWCKELKCSPAELRRAVSISGVSIKAVRSWLAE